MSDQILDSKILYLIMIQNYILFSLIDQMMKICLLDRVIPPYFLIHQDLIMIAYQIMLIHARFHLPQSLPLYNLKSQNFLHHQPRLHYTLPQDWFHPNYLNNRLRHLCFALEQSHFCSIEVSNHEQYYYFVMKILEMVSCSMSLRVLLKLVFGKNLLLSRVIEQRVCCFMRVHLLS